MPRIEENDLHAIAHQRDYEQSCQRALIGAISALQPGRSQTRAGHGIELLARGEQKAIGRSEDARGEEQSNVAFLHVEETCQARTERELGRDE
eukprot:scaffold7047_cov204-Ochromonas_danica.AAC.2